MVARVPKAARYRDRQTGMVARVEKGCKVQRQIDRQVWLQGTEKYRQKGMVPRVAKVTTVQRQIDRQVWLQALQRLQGTEKYRKTGMAKKVTRHRDRQTGMVARVAKSCKVQRHIDSHVWLQGLQRLQGRKTERQTGMFA